MKPPDVSIVIPVFNERDNLRILLSEIRQALTDRSETWEVLFVDDGSDDGSREVLRALAGEDPHVRALRLAKNSGQSSALAIGFQTARAPVIVTLDADLQNDPADIPKLLDALVGCDLVSGVRAHRRDDFVRRVSSKIGNRARRLVVGDSITDIGCSLKAYRSHLLRGLPMFDGMHRFLPGLLENRGARVLQVPVNHRPRVHGESKYNINNRLWRGLADLAGVRWLQKRWIATESFEEMSSSWRPKPSGSSSDCWAKDASSCASSSSGSPPSAANAV